MNNNFKYNQITVEGKAVSIRFGSLSVLERFSDSMDDLWNSENPDCCTAVVCVNRALEEDSDFVATTLLAFAYAKLDNILNTHANIYPASPSSLWLLMDTLYPYVEKRINSKEEEDV